MCCLLVPSSILVWKGEVKIWEQYITLGLVVETGRTPGASHIIIYEVSTAKNASYNVQYVHSVDTPLQMEKGEVRFKTVHKNCWTISEPPVIS